MNPSQGWQRAINIYSTPTLPVQGHVLALLSTTSNSALWSTSALGFWYSSNRQPITGLITATSVALTALQHSKSSLGYILPAPSAAPHKTISIHCTALFPLQQPDFSGSGFSPPLLLVTVYLDSGNTLKSLKNIYVLCSINFTFGSQMLSK